MKNAGPISVGSVPVAAIIGLVIIAFMDTSEYYGAIGAAFVFVAGVFIAGILAIIFGILAVRSGTSRDQGKVGIILGLMVVVGGLILVLYVFIYSSLDDRRIDAARAVEEKAAKAAYDASPDIDSNSMATLLESPHLNVEVGELATLPGRKILVLARISGGRSGSKLAVFSMDGTPDPAFNRQRADNEDNLVNGLVTAPDGNILLAADCMHGNDSDIARWTKYHPAILLNRYGKCIGKFEDPGGVEVVRYSKDSRLYGLEWEPTDDCGFNGFRINLVEVLPDCRRIARKLPLAPSVSSRIQMDEYAHEANLKSLFFWPNGDIGLITYSSQVLRINPSGKRLLSLFKTGPDRFRGPDRFIGFLSDGSLILSDRSEPGDIAKFRNGKKVESFSKTLERLRERIEIQAAAVLSTGELVIAGYPAGNGKALQFVIVDSSGKEKKGFVVGKNQ